MRVHHYGFATNDLKASIRTFRLLGYRVGKPILDPTQKVYVAFVHREGESPIELVADATPDGPTKGLLSKVGNGLYHICYEVDDLDRAIEDLRQKRFLLRHSPAEATAFDGRRIAWMYNWDVGLIELLERSSVQETTP